MLKELLERGDGGPVAVDLVFVVGDATAQCVPLLRIIRQSCGDRHVFVHGPGDRLIDTHHGKNRRAMAAAHVGAAKGHDRKVVRQALERGIAAGPADAVDEYVA